jgi:hypothetical protein
LLKYEKNNYDLVKKALFDAFFNKNDILKNTLFKKYRILGIYGISETPIFVVLKVKK